MTLETKLLIDDACEDGAGTVEPVLNPRTGAVIANLAEASSAQVEAAVAAATRAFAQWSRTTPAERSGLLLKIADRIDAEAHDFAALEALNCGNPINCALDDEMPAIADTFRFFLPAPCAQ